MLLNVEAVIRDAARRRRTLVIRYRKKEDNITNSYSLEPYEFSDGYFWGFDLVDGHIKKFIQDRILEATVTQTRFVPRFPVKIH